MDPCLCSELLWCIPLHSCLKGKFGLQPRVGSCIAYLKRKNSVRIMCLYSSCHLVALGEPQSISYVPCCPHVAISAAWLAGNYIRAIEFRALCRYTWSSTIASLLSVRCLLWATTVPTFDHTILVSTINDADQGLADLTFRTPLAPYEKLKFLGSGGSMVTRLKLKEIDGRAPLGVEPAT
ncbi:hypothetical protein ACSBR2_005361 [Camellia fascicularis]